MDYSIVVHDRNGGSPSFPIGDPFYDGAVRDGAVLLYLGSQIDAEIGTDASRTAILIELGSECLGFHTGESAGREGDNRVGFARYRNGQDPPSRLVELVRQPGTSQAAIEAARAVFEAAGLAVVVCSDQAGRIVDRLVRPKYNAALRFLDEGLASAEAMDLTCRLGLSYPDGPIERLERGGLAAHYEVTQALFETYGSPGFAPARRSVVAARRRDRG